MVTLLLRGYIELLLFGQIGHVKVPWLMSEIVNPQQLPPAFAMAKSSTCAGRLWTKSIALL
jgi:hypothetical protein